MRRSFLVVVLFALVLLSACGGDSEGEMTGAPETPVTSAEPETPSAPETSPSEEEAAAPATDVAAEADKIVSCLKGKGIEAKFEKSDLPVYEEKGEIAVTFEYEDLQITVPDAVTLWLHESEEDAAKTQKGINQNLLEGDTKAELAGTVVVDDFGTTLKEPEAAEQAAALDSCLA